MAEPLPIGIALKDLRPTQMTVGFREVEITSPVARGGRGGAD